MENNRRTILIAWLVYGRKNSGDIVKKLIKLYGERNTNTNYISKLIQLNLDVEEVPGIVPSHIMGFRIRPGMELIRDTYFTLTYKNNLGWKHSKVKPASELRRHAILKNDISFLTITKNPYSWLLSLYRNPYHQYHKKNLDFEAFLHTPWKTVYRDNCKALRNPVELWNQKNSSYLHFAELSHLNITTESIFQDPKTVIDRISKEFFIDKSTDYFLNFEKSTKDQSKSFAHYQEYYLDEKWREDLSEEAISTINQSVNKDLMRHFGYKILA